MGKQDQTLSAIFETPTRSDIRWSDIVSLLRAVGADISEGRGSRVRVVLNGQKAVFHRPHPGDQTGKPTVRDIKDFLIEAGIEP
ncbi:type II toxin-antitoxin system HicA family toxin [Elstera cyanobacteriorum]|uniref:type II toxin-antitoxin system HicA family toxin n=1 Tax=Elstera cyanobacteriorum TaxID=2022747 RepID=UPI0023571B0E|nr:type II toxin-antitoxin system HicA family toxin [Elstera cyanobacteriorum]MCK6442877.1 type II toxin-antitoxin system HicA family toxin [Elstera cyanobacteriorum]